MPDNTHLHRARKEKNNEFLTRMEDIERELSCYPDAFLGKSVYCNCDDPFSSNFFKYFAERFDRLGLSRLTATCMGGPVRQETLPIGDGPYRPVQKIRLPLKAVMTHKPENIATGESGILELLSAPGNSISQLEGDGDFRSRECERILEESDVVVTNPPFSLFREHIGQISRLRKHFLLVGNQCAITYGAINDMMLDGRLWLGHGFRRNSAHFISPYDDNAYDGEHVDGMIRVSGVQWFTDLDRPERHRWLALTSSYDPERHLRYANCNAINVDRTQDIPGNYDGLMGVPITFLNKWCPEQFELFRFRKGDDGRNLVFPDGREPFFRIIIRKAGKKA